jgi:hypothetical protein
MTLRETANLWTVERCSSTPVIGGPPPRRRNSEERIVEGQRQGVLSVGRGLGAVVLQAEGPAVGFIVSVLQPPDQALPNLIFDGRRHFPQVDVVPRGDRL